MAMSATSSVSTSGVLVTRTPRAFGMLEIDRIRADAVDGDDLERRQRLDKLGRGAGTATGDDAADAATSRCG